MVKGVSKQVLVVQGAEPKLFEQAIFILKDKAVTQGVTDEMLLKQAQQAIRGSSGAKKRKLWLYGPVWACGGAMLTALVWLVTVIL
jgi:hypothetical protein